MPALRHKAMIAVYGRRQWGCCHNCRHLLLREITAKRGPSFHRYCAKSGGYSLWAPAAYACGLFERRQNDD